MKSRIIIFFLFLSISLSASTETCKLDIYFGNGVWNDKFKAEASREKLKEFIQLHYPERFSNAEDGATYSVKYIHNRDNGIINDLIETHWQLYESGQISQSYFSFMVNLLDGVDNTNTSAQALRTRLINIIKEYNLNLDDMIKVYRELSLDKRNNVILVAHSQGNLFGNKVYKMLSEAEKKKFSMVSVGTPADNVTGEYDNHKASYVTLTGDQVMKMVPGSLTSNADGTGHSFVEAYLNNPNYAGVEAIAGYIKKATEELDMLTCKEYKYYRLISYICPNSFNDPLELTVDIMGSGIDHTEEYVVSDTRHRVAQDASGNCLMPWSNDYRTSVSAYDKNGCIAYTFDDTSGNYHSLDYITLQTYRNSMTCTEYKMKQEVTDRLRSMEAVK